VSERRAANDRTQHIYKYCSCGETKTTTDDRQRPTNDHDNDNSPKKKKLSKTNKKITQRTNEKEEIYLKLNDQPAAEAKATAKIIKITNINK
jgi:hypothetical protein